jgi:hypothetical protein
MTLANFKRAMCLGAAVDTFHNRNNVDMGRGKVCRVQSTGMWIQRGDNKPSFLAWPKSREIVELDADTWKVYWPPNPELGREATLVLTYKRVSQ